MKKYLLIIIGVFLAMILGASIFWSRGNQHTQEDIKEKDITSLQQYKISVVELPENISFANEEVPVDLYYVRESLDKELTVNTYWHSSTLLMMKRSSRYFPIIEPILKEEGVPEDFKYVALIESGFENVTSPAGAVGFWQFLKGTARDFGLEVNSEVDERYHLEKASRAACAYFKDAYEDYGNWTLVAAAYNAGKRGINRQIDRQKEEDYYDLLLDDETERYIFRILALKTIFSNPEKYGFNISEADLYPPIPTYTVTIDDEVPSWADFAKENGITYRILKNFNPWLRQSYLKNRSGKEYEIKLPRKEHLNYEKQ
ncbi:MAG: lytic transglycosylase domain-containing protein [Bacteroidales bacterium]|nr:lytic transglycosylase domain-containing protein [Bacteroidales bacterium]